jgi:hypothetical protein
VLHVWRWTPTYFAGQVDGLQDTKNQSIWFLKNRLESFFAMAEAGAVFTTLYFLCNLQIGTIS